MVTWTKVNRIAFQCENLITDAVRRIPVLEPRGFQSISADMLMSVFSNSILPWNSAILGHGMSEDFRVSRLSFPLLSQCYPHLAGWTSLADSKERNSPLSRPSHTRTALPERAVRLLWKRDKAESSLGAATVWLPSIMAGKCSELQHVFQRRNRPPPCFLFNFFFRVTCWLCIRLSK